MVVKTLVLEQVHRAAGRTALGVGRAEDHAVESAVDDGPGAHRARFLCDVEGAACEAPVAERLLGGGEGDISAWAVASLSISTWLKPRERMRPSWTITAPMGTSSASHAFAAGVGFAHEVVVAAQVDNGFVSHVGLRWRAGFLECPLKGIALDAMKVAGENRRGVFGKAARFVRGRFGDVELSDFVR